MPQSLTVSAKLLAAHFRSIAVCLRHYVDRSVRPELDADWGVVPLVAGLFGNGCEFVARNRGRDVQVAPVQLLGNGLWAWVSYREEWGSASPAGHVQRFTFSSAGLTFHLGYRYVRHKPQMFRAEWVGWESWDGIRNGFPAGNAAHPHWQFDAVESLKRQDASERADVFLSVLRNEEQETEPHDFSPQSMNSEDVNDLVSIKELSRIHFASAAAWWKPAPNDAHAHTPKSLREIQAWVDKTLGYVVGEFIRL